MPKLNEVDCRKPDWQPGAEVVLSDGQVWHFPRPRVVYRMRLDATTRIPALTVDATGQSPTYGEMLDRLSNTTGDAEFLSLLTAMALELLGQNYTIPDDAVPDLFTFDPGSQVSGQRWNALADCVKGVSTYPKV
jgi:hypothetical protein